ncbi:hypothetical protein QOT17_004245 [Balamuthia mandrillaris]
MESWRGGKKVALLLVGLFLLVSVTVEQQPQEELRLEGKNYVAVFPERYPALRLYPKDPQTGQVYTDHYFLLEVEYSEEKADCWCCHNPAMPLISATIDCNKTNKLVQTDLRTINWTTSWDPVVPQRLIWRSVDWVGDAELLAIYEANPEERTVPLSNGQKERNLTVSANSVKFSVQVNNYNAVQLSDEEQEQKYFAIAFYFLASLNREVYWTEWGAFEPDLAGIKSPYQVPLRIRTLEPPFLNVTFLQALFNMAEPPSVSKEINPNDTSEWGFEYVDLYQDDPYFMHEGVRTGQRLHVVYPAGQNIFYDPDISILFDDVGGEQTDEGDDGDEDTGRIIGIVVGVLLGALLLLFVAGAITLVVLKYVRPKQNLEELGASSGTVNFN